MIGPSSMREFFKLPDIAPTPEVVAQTEVELRQSLPEAVLAGAVESGKQYVNENLEARHNSDIATIGRVGEHIVHDLRASVLGPENPDMGEGSNDYELAA